MAVSLGVPGQVDTLPAGDAAAGDDCVRRPRVLHLVTGGFSGATAVAVDLVRGSLDLRLPDGASASLDDVTVYGGSARDRRKNPPAEGKPHVVLTGRVVLGSVTIRGPKRRQVPALPMLRRR